MLLLLLQKWNLDVTFAASGRKLTLATLNLNVTFGASGTKLQRDGTQALVRTTASPGPDNCKPWPRTTANPSPDNCQPWPRTAANPGPEPLHSQVLTQAVITANPGPNNCQTRACGPPHARQLNDVPSVDNFTTCPGRPPSTCGWGSFTTCPGRPRWRTHTQSDSTMHTRAHV